MLTYRAPLRDMQFLIHDCLDFGRHYAGLPNGTEVSPDLVNSILEESAKLAEGVFWPLYHSGDREGCTIAQGVVTTPTGFREAYRQYVEAGWQSMDVSSEYGGQGLPTSLSVFKNEMLMTANFPLASYAGLGVGCMNTLLLHGSAEQKACYVPRLATGEWGGSMCLTEPHCGTDLGQIRTRAEPQADGSYRLTGTKIFITGGEHDLTENIIHILLARLPDAPTGTRGISLFAVPKFLVNEAGELGERNTVKAGSIEHKMGLNGSATCVMNFDGARGFLVGPVNKGMECMFTFMNIARIGTAIQGVGTAELAYQGARNYALERRAMRALSGKKEPDHVADAIIHHGDVRRMLLTMRVFAEGGRAMLYSAAKMADHMVLAAQQGDKATYEQWDDKLGMLTPILKGCLTEWGQESASIGIQVYGGHGYIRENGMEQILRDARISTIYEGTTGIQALDLLGRKVMLMTRGKAVRDLSADILKFCAANATNPQMRRYVWPLARKVAEWNLLTTRLMLRASKDRDLIGCAAQDYLMYSGYVMLAYTWAQMAKVALAKPTDAFYQAKIHAANFCFDRILPRTLMHADAMMAPASSVMAMPTVQFQTW